jgi:hypothetical protein
VAAANVEGDLIGAELGCHVQGCDEQSLVAADSVDGQTCSALGDSVFHVLTTRT